MATIAATALRTRQNHGERRRRRGIILAVQALENPEDLLGIFGFDPDAIVLYGKHHLSIRDRGPDIDDRGHPLPAIF